MPRKSMIVLFLVLISTLFAIGTEEEIFDKEKREDLLLQNLEPGKVPDQQAEDCDKDTCIKNRCNCCPGYGAYLGGLYRSDKCKKCDCGQEFSCSYNNFTRVKKCICDTGYSDVSGKCKADCNKNPCENGGTCTVENNEVICTCKGPYTGKLCDKRDPCILNPCKNGGTCVTTGDTTNCQCPETFEGEFCEKDPYAPADLRNTSVSNTSVALRWENSKSSIGNIWSYRVQLKNSSVERHEFTKSNATSYTVKGLWPYVEYTFKVAAVTAFKQGPWSEECIVRTEVGVPYPPENLNTTLVTNTSIGLIWDRPTLSTGPILKYRVYWMNAIDIFEENTHSNHTFYTVQKLRPYDVYTFKVLAVTEAGPGPWSKERYVWTDIGIPNAPINLQISSVTNTTVSLKWYEPPVPTGPLLFYRIVWRNGRFGGSEDTPKNETSYTLKDLSPYVLYTFNVLAVSKAGAGEASEEIEVHTDVGVPHAPINLKQTYFTNTSVSLKWEEPPKSTGPILFYRIHWRYSNRVEWEDTPSNETLYTVKRLKPFVLYTFMVSAVTEAGIGAPSEELPVQTKVGELTTEVITKPEGTTETTNGTTETTTDLVTDDDDFTTTETYETMTSNENWTTTEYLRNMTSDSTRDTNTTDAVNITVPATPVEKITPTTGTITTTTTVSKLAEIALIALSCIVVLLSLFSVYMVYTYIIKQ